MNLKKIYNFYQPEKCVGCKYLEYAEWLNAEKDTCYLCDSKGSEWGTAKSKQVESTKAL